MRRDDSAFFGVRSVAQHCRHLLIKSQCYRCESCLESHWPWTLLIVKSVSDTKDAENHQVPTSVMFSAYPSVARNPSPRKWQTSMALELRDAIIECQFADKLLQESVSPLTVLIFFDGSLLQVFVFDPTCGADC